MEKVEELYMKPTIHSVKNLIMLREADDQDLEELRRFRKSIKNQPKITMEKLLRALSWV
jgi:hypothetical protein